MRRLGLLVVVVFSLLFTTADATQLRSDGETTNLDLASAPPGQTLAEQVLPFSIRAGQDNRLIGGGSLRNEVRRDAASGDLVFIYDFLFQPDSSLPADALTELGSVRTSGFDGYAVDLFRMADTGATSADPFGGITLFQPLGGNVPGFFLNTAAGEFFDDGSSTFSAGVSPLGLDGQTTLTTYRPGQSQPEHGRDGALVPLPMAAFSGAAVLVALWGIARLRNGSV
ncbi:MAG TPA: hypothetical protein VIL86_01590 [Tepidisphaeraceae bacterium]|jgi:hypothetical protein